MKKIIIILTLAILPLISWGQSTLVPGEQNEAVMYDVYHWLTTPTAYIYLPWDYATSGKTYPLIIFYKGTGENGSGGTDLPKMLEAGLPKVIDEGHPPYAINKTTGDTTWFIVLSPQSTSNLYTSIIKSWYSTVKDHYNLRIDTNRIYVTGLSLGGEDMNNTIEAPSTVGFHVAAGVCMSPAHSISSGSASYFQDRGMWFFQGDDDGTVGQTGTISYNTLIAANTDNSYKLTQYSGGHCCWVTYYDPSWYDSLTTRNTPGTNNISIYQYMMEYSLEDEPVVNVGPSADAGDDQTLAGGTTTTTLEGSGSDPDGTIVSYHWTTTSSATITSPDDATTTVTGLQDGNSYTFTLTVTDDSAATGNDDVVITVNEPAPPPDTTSYKISISPTTTMWNGDTLFYQVNDINSSGLAGYLFDEQGADPRSGVSTPTPVTDFTSGYTTKIYYPAQIVVDLGGIYRITNEYFYDHYGTDTLNLLYGTPGHWSTDTIKQYENLAAKWSDIGDTIYTRYLKIFYSNKGNQKVSEMILYGNLVSTDSLSRTPPSSPDRHNADPIMHDFIGVNVYGPTPPEVRDVAGTQRKYTNQSYIDHISPAGTPIDSVKFNYTTVHESHGSYEYYYFPDSKTGGQAVEQWDNGYGGGFNQYDTSNIVLFWSTQGKPQYAVDSGGDWHKSIDLDLHPGATGDSAQDYDRMSRMAWTIGAVYGKNAYPIDSVQKNQDGTNDSITGVGTMHYIEAGNENNGTWLTGSSYYTPEQAVAYHSAYYDGDEGKLGSRMGIKTADSSIKVLFWGDANLHIQYLKGMSYWAYYTRDDHKLPFDIYNVHHYFSDNIAISPETWNGGCRIFFKGVVDSAHLFCPNCQVWLSEWGYDRNRQSTLGVPIIDGKDSAQIQADWEARAWFELSFSGLDRAQVFQIQNDPLTKDYDSVGVSKFNTTGLTSGHQDPATYEFNYYAYPVYYFQHTVWKALGNYKPDSIIYENNDSIWVYRYRNATNTDSVAYAIWSGTQTNRSTTDYAIKTGHASTSTRIIKLADKAMYGDTTNTTSGTDSTINLTITETPQILFTTAGKDGGILVDNSTPVYTPPTAHAGSDQTLDPGTTSTTLSGTATAGDGTITGYAWTQVSGTTVTIGSPTSASTSISGLADGNTYVFRLTVTDSNDLTASDDVQVTVGSTPPPTGTLKFKWLKKYGAYYYLIYMNTSTGRYYYWKLL